MRTFLKILTLLLASTRVIDAAPIVYQNGPLAAQGSGIGGSARGYFAADDFVLAADTLVTGTDWFGFGAQLQWLIFTNDVANASPDDLLALGSLNPDGTFASPIFLQGGVKYWFAVIDGDIADPCTVHQLFRTSELKGDKAKAISHPLVDLSTKNAAECEVIKNDFPFTISPGFWSRSDFIGIAGGLIDGQDPNFGVAFELYGATVPEPSTPVLIGVAAAAFARRIYRRRS